MGICNGCNVGIELAGMAEEIKETLKELEALRKGERSKTYDEIKRRVLSEFYINNTKFGGPVLEAREE